MENFKMKNWVEKYRPKKFEDVVGQDKTIEKIKEFLINFPGKKKAILLNGKPGVGKTTVVHVLANENNFEIFELNASDLRNKSSMDARLKPVLQQKSLFEKNKLILVDEVDGLSGMQDRGGVSELVSLIEKTSYPIICTANDAWVKKLSPLRKKVEIVELEEIAPSIIKELLKQILKKEKREVTQKVLNEIVIKSKGDLRSAINDLEAASALEKPEEIEISERNTKQDIFQVISHIFQDRVDEEMLSTFDKVNLSLDEIILWIEENIPKVYGGKELVKAYERLGNVDLFKGRIYKQQYWRFLVYENIFLSYGISQAKGDVEKKGFYKYQKPGRILKIWLNNVKHAKRKSIAIKYAAKTHVGQKRIMAQWEEVRRVLKNPLIQKELKLDEDEIGYVMRY
jgi:replication factor C large subunit